MTGQEDGAAAGRAARLRRASRRFGPAKELKYWPVPIPTSPPPSALPRPRKLRAFGIVWEHCCELPAPAVLPARGGEARLGLHM